MNNYYRRPKKAVLKKIIIFLAIIAAPIILVMLIFTPLASYKERKKILSQYRLIDNYSRQDFNKLIEYMAKDKEFVYYFKILDEFKRKSIIDEAWETVDKNRSRTDLFNAMEKLVEDVQSKAAFFAHLEYPVDFAEDPSKFPELENSLWRFIEMEFTLSIIGAVYKGSYDNHFVFKWDPLTRQAAQKALRIFLKMAEQKTLHTLPK